MKDRNLIFILPIWVEGNKIKVFKDGASLSFLGDLLGESPTAPGSCWVSEDLSYFHYIGEDSNERRLLLFDFPEGSIFLWRSKDKP